MLSHHFVDVPFHYEGIAFGVLETFYLEIDVEVGPDDGGASFALYIEHAADRGILHPGHSVVG